MGTPTRAPPQAPKVTAYVRDTNELWDLLQARLMDFFPDKFAKTPAERAHYRPRAPDHYNISLAGQRMKAASFVANAPEDGEDPTSVEVSGLLTALLEQNLGYEAEAVWGNGCCNVGCGSTGPGGLFTGTVATFGQRDGSTFILHVALAARGLDRPR